MDTNPLLLKKCVPCEGGVEPLNGKELKNYQSYLSPEWRLEGKGDKTDGKNKKIERKFKFKDFKEAMSFINKVAPIAESEGHHPDIEISYNRVELELTTHAIGGLSPNDFIMAAKIDGILKP